ncbi:hypothetical protein ATKI12_6961 [Kitasatospora sp. Ki12]
MDDPRPDVVYPLPPHGVTAGVASAMLDVREQLAPVLDAADGMRKDLEAEGS